MHCMAKSSAQRDTCGALETKTIPTPRKIQLQRHLPFDMSYMPRRQVRDREGRAGQRYTESAVHLVHVTKVYKMPCQGAPKPRGIPGL